ELNSAHQGFDMRGEWHGRASIAFCGLDSPQIASQGGNMLVLTRRRDEAIIIRNRIGTEIRLLVVDVRGNKVRLGIEAPAEVNIVREEVGKPGAAVEACARELAWI